MSTSFEELIKQSEPRTVAFLHIAKVVLVVLALLSLVVAIIGVLLGFASPVWFYAFAALMAFGIATAFLANRRSESLFANRAAECGLNKKEAKAFWRAYDWDQDIAEN